MSVTRRVFLAGTVAGAGAVALVGCGSGSSGGGQTASTGTPLVALADVPVGGAVVVALEGGEEVVVAQPSEGAVTAFSAACTHQGCTVEVGASELSCPCHGSRFALLTGEVLAGPAPTSLPTIAVEVVDGQVVTA